MKKKVLSCVKKIASETSNKTKQPQLHHDWITLYFAQERKVECSLEIPSPLNDFSIFIQNTCSTNKEQWWLIIKIKYKLSWRSSSACDVRNE